MLSAPFLEAVLNRIHKLQPCRLEFSWRTLHPRFGIVHSLLKRQKRNSLYNFMAHCYKTSYVSRLFRCITTVGSFQFTVKKSSSLWLLRNMWELWFLWRFLNDLRFEWHNRCSWSRAAVILRSDMALFKEKMRMRMRMWLNEVSKMRK